MALPDRARSRAILIGTSAYQDHRLHDLPAVANNLADLKAALTDPRTGSFAAEHCTVIENPTDDRQVLATLTAIAAAAEDALLVYYAGHGVLGTRQHELYFGLATTNIDRPQYSALSLSWVRDEILESTASTKVLILDCCFSGRAIDEFMADEESLIMGAISVSGTYTLASSSANAASLAPTGARHTAFSGELLSLLEEGVPTGPSELDLLLIYQQLHRRMLAKGWPAPKQRGTDNVHGLALGQNPGHVVSMLDGRLAAATDMVAIDPQRGVDLLRHLAADAETALPPTHPFVTRCRAELRSASDAVAVIRETRLRREQEERLRAEAAERERRAAEALTAETARRAHELAAADRRLAEEQDDILTRLEREFERTSDMVNLTDADTSVASASESDSPATNKRSDGEMVLGCVALIVGPYSSFAIGDALKHAFLMGSLGFGNIVGLMFWILALAAIAVVICLAIGGEKPAVGFAFALGIFGPGILGFIFGGHLWNWLDAPPTAIAHLLIFRF